MTPFDKAYEEVKVLADKFHNNLAYYWISMVPKSRSQNRALLLGSNGPGKLSGIRGVRVMEPYLVEFICIISKR